MRRITTGLTLIEAITAMAVLSIMLTIGVPAIMGAIERMRIQTTMYLLGSDFALARNTALMRRTEVVVCPSDTSDRCRPDRHWSGGWLIFLDPDGNRQPDAPEDLIRVTRPPTPANGRIRVQATRTFTRFQRDGRSAGTNLSVHFCRRQEIEGSVVINNLGRIRSSRASSARRCPD